VGSLTPHGRPEGLNDAKQNTRTASGKEQCMRSDSAAHLKAMKSFFSAVALAVGIATFVGSELPNMPRLAAQTPAAQANFTFPDTLAAKQLQARVAAFDSGDRATIQAFVAKSMPEGTGADFTDQTIQMRDQFRGLDFQKVEESRDVRLVVIAQTRLGGERIRMTVEGFRRTAPDQLDFPPAGIAAREHSASTRDDGD
jgi:hypothetical protein